jgi:GMP synthase (glutamine-hydrolysing)
LIVRHQTVVVLDFGSQYTQLVARRIREAGVYCEIRPCTDRAPDVVDDAVIGVVLSGGPASVLGDDAPPFDARWLGFGVPVLGVCYGMQLTARTWAAAPSPAVRRASTAKPTSWSGTGAPCPLFDAGATTTVWMSHGDHVAVAPPGFRVVATSGGAVAAIGDPADDRTFGLQFHPEVTHSVDGAALIGRLPRRVRRDAGLVGALVRRGDRGAASAPRSATPR